ncbi:MAG: (d)CMP kinase [Actinomycetota bacterium]|nr:(d)CMP kinase [Actinomycetota bacterium]
MIVAIDGPAASGKSTVAKTLATRIGMHYLDTGAMYRSVALEALARGISLDDESAMGELARSVRIDFAYEGDAAIATTVMLNGRDVSADIRTPRIDDAVSVAARNKAVRSAMVKRQREIASTSDTVMEGRDIGTVVFPDADVKVFLTASADERARRRHVELSERGVETAADRVREGLVNRDHADSSRETAPLRPAEDAIQLDTTGMTIHDVVAAIAALVDDAR